MLRLPKPPLRVLCNLGGREPQLPVGGGTCPESAMGLTHAKSSRGIDVVAFEANVFMKMQNLRVSFAEQRGQPQRQLGKN